MTVRGMTGSENGCFCGACVADLGVAPGSSARGVLCWSGETHRDGDGDRVALLASETPNGVGCRFPGTRSALSVATLPVAFTLVDVLLTAVGVVFATAVARCGLRVQMVVEPSRERSLYPGLRQTLSRDVCLDL